MLSKFKRRILIKNNKTKWNVNISKIKNIYSKKGFYLKPNNKNKKRTLIFLKKTLNNYFLTLTNIVGNVIISFSYGKVKIFTKKRRRSRESYKD